MCEVMKTDKEFIGYEYHSISVPPDMESIYADGYQNFGWVCEEVSPSPIGSAAVNMNFKRNRKIRNKAELTRLQRQFEACADEIVTLKKSTKSYATIAAFTIGLLGCSFLAGAVFSYMAGMLPLMVVFAIPGFLGWILPIFFYQSLLAKRRARNAPLIDKKHDEIYDVCEKANHLLA